MACRICKTFCMDVLFIDELPDSWSETPLLLFGQSEDWTVPYFASQRAVSLCYRFLGQGVPMYLSWMFWALLVTLFWTLLMNSALGTGAVFRLAIVWFSCPVVITATIYAPISELLCFFCLLSFEGVIASSKVWFEKINSVGCSILNNVIRSEKKSNPQSEHWCDWIGKVHVSDECRYARVHAHSNFTREYTSYEILCHSATD